MKAWHGTGIGGIKKFDRRFIGSGEGPAKRGIGFNFALDPAVARFYAERAAGPVGYVYEVSIPDRDELIELDAPIDGNTYLLAEMHKRLGLQVDEVFEEAQCHDDVSMSYPDDRAEDMWERVLNNSNDEDAWDELREFSPGYDWDGVRRMVEASLIQFDVREDTMAQLYECAVDRLGTEGAHAMLRQHGLVGTIGEEPISEMGGEAAFSVVIFDPDDIVIRGVEQVRLRRSAPGVDDTGPGGP